MKPWWIVAAVVIVAVVVIGIRLMGSRTGETPTAQVNMPVATAPADTRNPQGDFLTENAKKPGWKSTGSGLQYMVEKAGDPNAPHPAPGSEVTVNYEGRLIDGTIFDSSYARNEPATFPLSGVIQGWQEGVPLMRQGETWEFAIPANLAYGDNAVHGIPRGSTLLFKIELLNVKTPAP
jgi:FKBP-type peptidyl-prolyl cis-trans isomerase FkpA